MLMRSEQSSKDTLVTFLPANDDLEEFWTAGYAEKALLPDLQYLEARVEFQQEKNIASLFHFPGRYMPLPVRVDLC